MKKMSYDIKKKKEMILTLYTDCSVLYVHSRVVNAIMRNEE